MNGVTTNKRPSCYNCGVEKEILKAFSFGSGKNYVEFMKENQENGATILWFCDNKECQDRGIISLF